MNASHFDRISKAFAGRRTSRRQTLATAAASLAAMAGAATGLHRPAAAQEATPEPEVPPPDAAHHPTMLFVQTYQSGYITPTEGVDGRYTLTLEQGHGQTIYFSDRPDRIVGATDTPQFLEDLGFPDDNPPNAALVVETAPGETDIAVVELFNPLYDPVSQGVTYEIEVLANWQDELGVGLSAAPTDLAAIEPSFGAAHLFIDGYDCPNGTITCTNGGQAVGTIPGSWFDNFCSHELMGPDSRSRAYCVPCRTPADVLAGPPPTWKANVQNVWSFWGNVCNERIPACNGNCRPAGWCEPDPYWQNACPNYS